MELLSVLWTQLAPELITAASAGLTFVIVAGIKKAQNIKWAQNKGAILRPIAAVLAFLGVVAGSLATGTELPDGAVPAIVDVLISSALAFAGATAIHEVKNG